jgi:hypothetical protein
MSETMSGQEIAYNELLPAISSVSDELTVTNSMPIDEAAAEAQRVGALVKQYDAILRKTGIDTTYLDTLVKRIGAFVWSAAVIQSLVETETTANKEWNARKSEGVEIRRVLIRTFQYAFRNDSDLLESVQLIIDGKGNRDFLLDILSCSKLGKSNINLLTAINADVTLLDKAAILYTELSDIFSRMSIDPVKHSKAVSIYNKAWTYLKEALDEIYEAGRYAFDESDERHGLFYSDYYVRLGQSSAKAKAALEAEKAEAAKELVTA